MAIFVFGSNLAGRHGKGDALTARQRHGAIYGQGEGLQGQSYAIPTKDGRPGRPALTDPRATLPLAQIAEGVTRFVAFAQAHPELEFEIMPVGCGLAGYRPIDIAPLFRQAPSNCAFNAVFADVLAGMGVPVRQLRSLSVQATLF